MFDGKQLRLYVDGKLQKNTGTPRGQHKESRHRFFVGADPNEAGSPHNFFNGIIYEVQFSRSARYTKSFRVPRLLLADSETLLMLHFDEGKGKTTKDASGNGHDGLLQGARWVKAH